MLKLLHDDLHLAIWRVSVLSDGKCLLEKRIRGRSPEIGSNKFWCIFAGLNALKCSR